MGRYQSYVQFNSREELLSEFKEYLKREPEVGIEVEVVCVLKTMEDIATFQKGEWLLVVGGEYRALADPTWLEASTGIRAKDTFFIYTYEDMASECGLELGEFLNKHFKNVPKEEVNKLLNQEGSGLKTIEQLCDKQEKLIEDAGFYLDAFQNYTPIRTNVTDKTDVGKFLEGEQVVDIGFVIGVTERKETIFEQHWTNNKIVQSYLQQGILTKQELFIRDEQEDSQAGKLQLAINALQQALKLQEQIEKVAGCEEVATYDKSCCTCGATH